MTLDVIFRSLKDITPILLDPDTLILDFIVPELIIDAETFEHLSES